MLQQTKCKKQRCQCTYLHDERADSARVNIYNNWEALGSHHMIDGDSKDELDDGKSICDGVEEDVEQLHWQVHIHVKADGKGEHSKVLASWCGTNVKPAFRDDKSWRD
jgi:hypothetical protein